MREQYTITSIKVPYKVQFSYTDRMGDQKYYNKAGYVDPEDTSSYTFVENATNVEGVESHSVKVTLTDSFILSLAPYESNFTKNLTWDNPKDSKPFDSSVNSSIASAVVNSTQSDRTIHLNVFRDKNGVPTPRKILMAILNFSQKMIQLNYLTVQYSIQKMLTELISMISLLRKHIPIKMVKHFSLCIGQSTQIRDVRILLLKHTTVTELSAM